MNTVSIISIGNELLSGQCVDTNRAWLGEQLSTAGFEVVSGFVVADEVKIVSDAIKNAASQANIVLITGGLGPTDDDLTRQSVADYLGVELEFRQDLFDTMTAYFKARNYSMVEKNRIQAFVPQGAIALNNEVGTAPGFAIKQEGKLIAAMPGVPVEMKEMFLKEVMPLVAERVNGSIVLTKRLKCFGIGESTLNEKLGDIMLRGQNPLVNCTVKQGVITLHIVAKSDSKEAGETLISEKEAQIRAVVGEFIYGIDGENLEDTLARQMTEKKKKISTAESCTGGLIAKMITEIPGSSVFFEQGWVTYCDRSKHEQLGVSLESLEKFGAVSEQVAEEMAIGALRNSGSDVAVAVTGIAGPSGGSEQKPVGLVYIALASEQKTIVKRYNFPHNRSVCRLRTAQTAIYTVLKEFLAIV